MHFLLGESSNLSQFSFSLLSLSLTLLTWKNIDGYKCSKMSKKIISEYTNKFSYSHIQQLQKRMLTTSVSTFLSLQVHKATFSPSETWEALQELDKVMLFLISAQISYRAFYDQRANILQSFLSSARKYPTELLMQPTQNSVCWSKLPWSRLSIKEISGLGLRCNKMDLEYLQCSKFARNEPDFADVI